MVAHGRRQARLAMGEVFVVGVASTACWPSPNTAGVARETARTALADAGIAASAVSAVFIASGRAGPEPSAETVAVRLGLRTLGVKGGHWPDAPSSAGGRVENVSVSGVEALTRAVRAIELGIDDLVLCIGADRPRTSRRPWATWPATRTCRHRTRGP